MPFHSPDCRYFAQKTIKEDPMRRALMTLAFLTVLAACAGGGADIPLIPTPQPGQF